MSKYKNLPRCPWCGYMMRLRKLNNNDTVYAAYYRCTNCNAPSPQVYAGSAEDVESKAYKAAVTRWQEPNRVLTLDELKTYIGYAWYEGDHEWYHSSFDYPVWIENGKYNYEGDLYDIPDDVAGRFWLRKPTDEERKNTPKEDKDDE